MRTALQIWDPRQKAAVDFIDTDFPVTALTLAEAGNELYSGGIDNDIKVWDLRKKAVAYSLIGHNDTITSLAVSPDSQTLLSNSHDSTVRTWDIRPFAPSDRQIRTFDGAATGLEKNLFKATWDTQGSRIAAGGGDGTAVIWEASTGKLLHKLPGHKGAVNDVRFAPHDEPLGMLGMALVSLLTHTPSAIADLSTSAFCLDRQIRHARRGQQIRGIVTARTFATTATPPTMTLYPPKQLTSQAAHASAAHAPEGMAEENHSCGVRRGFEMSKTDNNVDLSILDVQRQHRWCQGVDRSRIRRLADSYCGPSIRILIPREALTS